MFGNLLHIKYEIFPKYVYVSVSYGLLCVENYKLETIRPKSGGNGGGGGGDSADSVLSDVVVTVRAIRMND